MKFINNKYRTDHNKDLNKLLSFMDKSKYNKKHRSSHNWVIISESREKDFTSDISGTTFRMWMTLEG
jgi:hypothetical protein